MFSFPSLSFSFKQWHFLSAPLPSPTPASPALLPQAAPPEVKDYHSHCAEPGSADSGPDSGALESGVGRGEGREGAVSGIGA